MTSRLSICLNLGTLLNLPEWSKGPRGTATEIAQAIKLAGYSAIQGSDDPAYAAAGLATYGSGRVVEAKEAYEVLARNRDHGHGCTTLHVGTGFESDREALALIEAVLSAGDSLGHRGHIETHRATITQDIWRTLNWVERLPEITFNADLSHWYTGLEMPYGDFNGKLDAMAPIFERVRFLHGRIGSAGSIQVAIGVGARDEPHVGRFVEMWTRCFDGFLRCAEPNASIVFAPELLPNTAMTPEGPLVLDYALTAPDEHNRLDETSDRWDQSWRLVELAKQSYAAAAGRL